jgi:uncharacterized protein YkwD
MPRRFIFCTIALLCISLVVLSFPVSSKAETFLKPRYAGTAYDLINAVNILRASYGLAPYSINPILMYTAQTQADFMAANGTVTHSGSGGISVSDRLLAAGYPLAGDLSQGGFRSENITGGLESMSAQTAVDQWTGDAPHLNTMISPNLTEIGAGVAVVNGRVYYVIDCALPTTAGIPQSSTTPMASGAAVPPVEAPIQPFQAVVVSTSNPQGEVIHEVKYGQSLWQIAITYETRIDEIKRLNNLSGNDIYPGEKLLIKMGVVAPTFISTESPTPEKQAIETATSPFAYFLPTTTPQYVNTATFAPTMVTATNSNSMTKGIVFGIVTAALLGGGVVAWMGSAKKTGDK